MTDIVVLGDINIDVISRINGPINLNSDTKSVNSLTVGGSTCNVASWIASTDVPVTLLAAVGKDMLGEQAITQLKSLGVTTTLLHHDADHATGTCVIVVDNTGQRTMFPDFGANLHFEINRADAEAIKNAKVLIMSAYTFFRAETHALALEALLLAKENGTKVVLDAASSAPIRETGAQLVRDYLSQADLVLANDDEMRELMQGDLNWFTTLPNLIHKHGPNGATWYSRGETKAELPAEPIDVVDTTGAGDSLCAGIVSKLVEFDDWQALTNDQCVEVLKYAIHLSALCCSDVGAAPRR